MPYPQIKEQEWFGFSEMPSVESIYCVAITGIQSTTQIYLDKVLLPGSLVDVLSSWETNVHFFVDVGCNAIALIDEDYVLFNDIGTEIL